MLPLETIGRATARDGTELVLYHRDGVFQIRVDGWELVSSRAHGSEAALASLSCAALGSRSAPRVLIGGLGMGYTLRAALDALPAEASVIVVELFGAVVDWNRGVLGSLARHPLLDPRTTVEVADVFTHLGRSAEPFDAILLDVDNGPACLTLAYNARLYSASGLARARRALRPDGVLAVWSPSPDGALVERAKRPGFSVTVHEIPARDAAQDPRHAIILGRAN